MFLGNSFSVKQCPVVTRCIEDMCLMGFVIVCIIQMMLQNRQIMYGNGDLMLSMLSFEILSNLVHLGKNKYIP